MKIDTQNIIRDAIHQAEQILNISSVEITDWKGSRDFATNIDLEIERSLKKLFQDRTPDIPLLSEEENFEESFTGTKWVLDPIDGTVNFYRGHPFFGISLALIENGRAIASEVFFPKINERFSAQLGKGAFQNGEPIKVSNTDSLDQSVIALGDFSVGVDAEIKNVSRLKVTSLLAKNCMRVRMNGSAALDLCMVANGTLDAAVILSNNIWDIQGAALILREAGGNLCDLVGQEHSFSSKETIVSSPQITSKLTDLLLET